MKYCRKIFILLLIFSCFSCASGGYLPGEKTVILRNLSAEYFNIAENYLNQKNYSKAIENYILSLRTAKKEDNIQTKYQLAKAYALNKNYNEAIDIFIDFYQQEPKNIVLAQSLAYCYAKTGKNEEAIAIYKNIYLENPYQENIANNYFLLLLEINEIDKAKLVLESFKTNFPESTKIQSLEENLEKRIQLNTKAEEKAENQEEENAEEKTEKNTED